MENARSNIAQAYDAWLILDLYSACNLSCKYCYNLSVKTKKPGLLASMLDHSLGWLKAGSPKTDGRTIKLSGLDISLFIKTLEKTNKIFRITFTGTGEPFCNPNIIKICKEVTKKHYISFNTNLTSRRIKEFCEVIDPQKVIWINASLHIKELERLHLMDVFVDNYLLCKNKGFNIKADEVACPELLGEVGKYKELFRAKGIEFEFTRFQGRYKDKVYPLAYTEQELLGFGIKHTPNLNSSLSSQGTICNAGYNVGVVQSDGGVVFCFSVNRELGHIYNNIQFTDALIECPAKKCYCPVSSYDPYLYKKALKDAGTQMTGETQA